MLARLISIILWSFASGIWFSNGLDCFVISKKKALGALNLVICVCCLLVSALEVATILNA